MSDGRSNLFNIFNIFNICHRSSIDHMLVTAINLARSIDIDSLARK